MSIRNVWQLLKNLCKSLRGVLISETETRILSVACYHLCNGPEGVDRSNKYKVYKTIRLLINQPKF